MPLTNYNKDLGLRIGIGVMFICHGIPKLMGGPAGWEGLAQHGLPFLPEGFISIAFGFVALFFTGPGRYTTGK